MNENISHDFRALPIGTILSDYQVDSILGQGSFGITYLALDTMLNRRVAVKEYFPREFAARDGTLMVRAAGNKEDRDNFLWGLDSFLKEARVLALFDHPNIVPVRRFFELNGTAYLVMDYCDGTPLDELIRANGPLSRDVLSRLITPVLEALELIHKANFLHRDIKPANIFIKSDGTPVLLDFGAARQDLVSHSKSVTSLATPGYGAIEQYSTHGNQGPWTDIYGFGTTLYRCITGDKPDDATDRLLNDNLISVVKRCSGNFGSKTLSAIDAAIIVRPENRPQSVSEWRRMFGDEIYSSSSNVRINNDIRVENPQPVDKAIKQNDGNNHKNKKIIAGGAVTVIFVGVLIAFFVDKNNSDGSNVKETVSAVPVPQNPNLKTPIPGPQINPEEKAPPTKETKKEDQKTVNLPPCPGTYSQSWTNCYGTFVFAKKDGEKVAESYKGEYKNGLYHGKGRYTYSDETYYDGEWKNGKNSGYGVMFSPDKFKYSGGWLDDKRHGSGTLEYLANDGRGQKYVGQFSNGLFNGKGTYTWPSGQKFIGNYLNGKSNGQGTLTLADGRRYVGNFVDGRYSGQGTFYDSKGGIVHQGLWQDGKPITDTANSNLPNSDSKALLQKCSNLALKTKREVGLPKNIDYMTIAVDIFCYQAAGKTIIAYKFDVISDTPLGGSTFDTFIRNQNKKLVCAPDLEPFLPFFDFEYQYFYSSKPSNFNPNALIGKFNYTARDCGR